MMSPTIENLNHLGPTLYLISSIVLEGLAHFLQQQMSGYGFLIAHPLESGAVLGLAPFHCIGSKGPRSSNKSNKSGFTLNFVSQSLKFPIRKRNGCKVTYT